MSDLTPAVPDPPVEALSEAERDALHSCECGHSGWEHNGLGCYGRISYEPLVKCICPITDDFDFEEAAVERILAARAVAPDALREQVEALAAEWEGRCDAVAITYQDPEARRRATSAGRAFVADLRAALAERPTDGAGT